jgi:hypothetical protein
MHLVLPAVYLMLQAQQQVLKAQQQVLKGQICQAQVVLAVFAH